MSAVANTSSHVADDASRAVARRVHARSRGGVRGWSGATVQGETREDIALAPRHSYLVRTLTIPMATPRETLAMVRLTLEASLPASFGAFCVGVLSARAVDGGMQQVRCAVGRDDAGSEGSSAAGGRGRVLPSQAVWSALLEQVREVDAWLLHADGEREVAVRLASGEVVVRAVRADERSMPAELLDVLQESGAPPLPARLCAAGDWELGALPPELVAVRPQGLDDVLHNAHTLATHVVRTWLTRDVMDRAELLSASARQQRDVSRGVRSLTMACGLLLLCGACAAGGFALETRRLERRIDALHAAVKQVEKDGDAAGVRVSQARAVREAARSRLAFFQGLSALHTVTGTGITFTSIASRDGKVLEAAGRAPSVGVPFLLPQQLEQSAVLRGVQLLDASQTQRGEASVVEFRLQCTLVPGGAP